LYADRLDPFSAFKPDDLELISAVAAQTAIASRMFARTSAWQKKKLRR